MTIPVNARNLTKIRGQGPDGLHRLGLGCQDFEIKISRLRFFGERRKFRVTSTGAAGEVGSSEARFGRGQSSNAPNFNLNVNYLLR